MHGCARKAVSVCFPARSNLSLPLSTASGSPVTSIHRASSQRQKRQFYFVGNYFVTAQTLPKLFRPPKRRTYTSIALPQSLPTSKSAEPPQTQNYARQVLKKQRRRYRFLYVLAALGGVSVLGFYFVPPVRRLFIAVERCAFVGLAVGGCILDYKLLFRKEWDDPAIRHGAYKACHSELAVQDIAWQKEMLITVSGRTMRGTYTGSP